MPPAANSNSKDKKVARIHVNSTFGILGNGYNLLSEKLHAFESIPVSSPSPLHVNGRFRNIDDTEDHNGNSLGAGIEYDTVSNNGSWSGESDDTKENKEKSSPPSRQEFIPGAENDKREKIRLKNERKHQRQKERRAQELHERCSGYLMSRKLEALAQQLVAMGFSLERATMALIMNEGRVEESVAWLFESAEEDKQTVHNLDYGGNLKIDVSEELAKITDLEVRYKVCKQEVERAVVACEGDIEKAEEMLKVAKQEQNTTLPKSEETGNHPTVGDSKSMTSISQSVMRTQSKLGPSISVQQKRDEKDFNYTKVAIMTGSSVDPGSKGGMQAMRKLHPKIDSVKQHTNTLSTDRAWPTSGASVPYSVASSLHSSSVPSNVEAHRLAVRDDMKNLQLGSMREPIIVMQRPKQAPSASAGSSLPGTTMGWQHPSSIDLSKSSGLVSPVTGSTSLLPGNDNATPSYNQHHLQHQQHYSSSIPNEVPSRTNGFSSWGVSSPTLSAASSLGLFSRLGATGASGPSSLVDWNTGSSMPQFDYSNIDWTLDLTLLASRSNGLWAAMNPSSQNSNQNAAAYGVGMKGSTKPFTVFPEGGANDPIPVGSIGKRAPPSRTKPSAFLDNLYHFLPCKSWQWHCLSQLSSMSWNKHVMDKKKVSCK